VTLPDHVDGTSYTLNLRNFATPSTILLGSFYYNTENDRPPATAESGEIRQFIEATNSSVHLNVSHYETWAKLKIRLFYGSVVANSIQGEWHQRMPELPLIPQVF